MKKIKEYILVLTLSLVLACVLTFILSNSRFVFLNLNTILLSTFPIIILFYRHGFYPAFLVGAIYGIGVGIIVMLFDKGNMLTVAAYSILGISLSINGLFAKNIHKTLNNRRMNSVWLNVITANGIITLIIFGLTFFHVHTINVISVVYYGLTSSMVPMVIAYQKPEWILTKRSPFLSRKERSKLLND
ncbi:MULTISPECIES: energy-coupled thiamine transporter ThiT [unclassified Granulicatella]|uniref:energy-coupled thiamine transporter ThiT n=1 Tax=unclassified Granulicatella TaxID=2630493 RepID=UPI00107408D8|nr:MULTISPECIES: energy-coupled thiamine transporter ThiT [unclassified Granulicatella]MBF0780427.1 energy-coupled thiamine transporter ThiT [Granulicatella sp. 19428wC4_WM01]TFU95416.1 hypothetical protein E4T68_04915 [Granulicatella sp. WM01]